MTTEKEDIVLRLREKQANEPVHFDSVLLEAANEIERLREFEKYPPLKYNPEDGTFEPLPK